MRAWVAVLVDVVCVLVFVGIGRATHDEALSLGGYLGTAWPFLVALGVGWAVTQAWKRAERIWPTGVVVWVVTVALGMVLRAVSGQGTDPAFVVVATLFLGAVLLGWRGLFVGLRQRR
ncbi:DUF3054 domain-containing protein [Actinomadura adrarensis]|uniref:DUF3054 domain-containing protein n=1 Tax=Actinomadura adrarensis TaxID=1819600 RepID=A0ABW3CJN2_9ACTN